MNKIIPSKGDGALATILKNARLEVKCTRGELTVLSPQVDPYRFDTSSGHRDGAWLAEQLDRAVGPERRIHWRGLHYAIVARGDVVKPNGAIYLNTDDDWAWLYNVAGKAARWLGYVDFERIIDNRNSDPMLYRKARVVADAWVRAGLYVDIPGLDDLDPTAEVSGFDPRQAFALAIFGEKTSLEDVLLPIADEFGADLYLPAGEISDSLLFKMARDGAADGRPLVVFTLTDFDPAGHQMSVSIGRKLQAFRDMLFPDLDFRVLPVGVTADQVRDLELPSTPLKTTEKRADRWREAFGVEQTEIDALATLRPDDLREIVREAIAPFYDETLGDRVLLAKATWMSVAQSALMNCINTARLAEIKDRAAEILSAFEEDIAEINVDIREAIEGDVDLPPINIPDPDVDDRRTRVGLLISSAWSWVRATRALIARKAYSGDVE